MIKFSLPAIFLILAGCQSIQPWFDGVFYGPGYRIQTFSQQKEIQELKEEIAQLERACSDYKSELAEVTKQRNFCIIQWNYANSEIQLLKKMVEDYRELGYDEHQKCITYQTKLRNMTQEREKYYRFYVAYDAKLTECYEKIETFQALYKLADQKYKELLAVNQLIQPS